MAGLAIAATRLCKQPVNQLAKVLPDMFLGDFFTIGTYIVYKCDSKQCLFDHIVCVV